MTCSRLGKIKTASQGQFSIESRDMNHPHIKNVRVVSTVTYYLVDWPRATLNPAWNMP